MNDETADSRQEGAAELGPAIEDFRSAVERQAAAVLSAAEERAAEHEREAVRAARRIEQDAERKAERILQAALARASSVLDSIDALEGELAGTMQGPRSEADRLTTNLTTQTKGDDESPAAQAASGIEDELALAPNGQLRNVVRATVYGMREAGRPRQDAKRFLDRFFLEDAHRDVLDEIYGPIEGNSGGVSAGARGWLHRRRAQ